MNRIERDGEAAYVGLPEREATKIADLWSRDEIGIQLSVEVHAPVVVGIYPMRISRFVTDGATNGYASANGGHASSSGPGLTDGDPAGPGQPARVDPHSLHAGAASSP